ncbi:MAG TPA: divergent PAP2 family protein [Candidatus Avoscillospira avicola]|uniref:Divergent PAP2 family protein n=1 Tax=Candidatus Avoscillospira avicola TaxID=2840706 RepID=A0A9D1IW05_9FIRM|nr:divergent PAP2 family protein [Candidatus Avoscillospira avicola]
MGDFLTGLWQNRILMAAIFGWLIAQVLKTILVLVLERELKLERLFGSGGMPSSHSATVCALAASTAILCGPSSSQFAISAVLAFIVMYDACNVRLETGKQAVAIKELQQFFQDMGKAPLSEEKLKELVGHTLPQVLAGALLGILTGVVAALV